MLPTIEKAFELLDEGQKTNPGPWKEHSIVVAKCAKKIAENCEGIDAQKAFILGLMHDIGRRVGLCNWPHTIEGYEFLMSLGYDEAAKVCLTHSFHNQSLDDFIGVFDISPERLEKIKTLLLQFEYDDYDRLIQLCDVISLPTGSVPMEVRIKDIKTRYGEFPEAKLQKCFWLKEYFEKKSGLVIDELGIKYEQSEKF